MVAAPHKTTCNQATSPPTPFWKIATYDHNLTGGCLRETFDSVSAGPGTPDVIVQIINIKKIVPIAAPDSAAGPDRFRIIILLDLACLIPNYPDVPKTGKPVGLGPGEEGNPLPGQQTQYSAQKPPCGNVDQLDSGPARSNRYQRQQD
ncbi:hypothetical protein BDK51DRAFT_25541 [Blyttiomyces helicus]|uniref:Uncharacterized protein n=1 Tax=Blyttiomyces helicus TaxID=388810 RepID=A0A4P9WEN0_9FUNG|nr:hypothetical protein BDK51DRAFT_25541 [Blyttiomyces helicus]|eukprot:RKO90852.1 hypothetical protein BDK51DRAFT_25541 [Blyttiomyces helicus]